MKIAIGSDHRGFEHKAWLIEEMQALGHSVVDFGCDGPESADYPDHAIAVGEAVASGRCDRGVLICGSGIGVSIAANKVAGIRASFCVDAEAAQMTRQHNDSNVICLSGDRTGVTEAGALVTIWLTTEFEGGRHGRRVQKILDYEEKHA
ncbi:MAG: ribose 5-phosphate isomerase B [bacterium]